MAKNLKPTIESDLVRELAGLLDETGLSEIEYGTDGLSIRVAKHAVASTASLNPAAVPVEVPIAAPKQGAPIANEASYADHPGGPVVQWPRPLGFR